MIQDAFKESGQDDYRQIMKQLSKEDGKLISPIDLSLEITKPLAVDSLKWIDINNPPKCMMLSNTGEIVAVSAKWNDRRPHLCGGPLGSNYVFSQVHFHWGADEHEGSEHTVRGVRYPLEIHVVFYKARYLTQDAALKHDDGLAMVAYLVKERSTPGLQWLVSHLPKVTKPKIAVMLEPSPLSAFVVPFSKDYLMYWGALATHRCSHPVMWLVSRSALAISTQDLNTFRTLLNSKSEPMTKTFREANPPMGRSLFHVSPSANTTHVLLPGCGNPPGQVLTVGYSVVSSLDQSRAEKVFSKGDALDDETTKTSKPMGAVKKVTNDTTQTGQTGPNKRKVSRSNETLQQPTVEAKRLSATMMKGAVKKVTNETTQTGQTGPNKRNVSRSNETLQQPTVEDKRVSAIAMKACSEVERVKLERRDHVAMRKLFEKQRKNPRSSTPQNVLLSAATIKRMQDRIANDPQQKKEINVSEKAVCVHTNPANFEAPKQTLYQQPLSHPKASEPEDVNKNPTTDETVVPVEKSPVVPPRRPSNGKAVRVAGRGNRRNKRTGCI